MASSQEAKSSPSAAPRWLSALLICTPLAVLAWSFASAPYFTNVGEMRVDELPFAPSQPILLYRNQGTRFYYTASDLLRPEAFGTPGQYISSVVYDVWPATDAPRAARGESLTWFTQIWTFLQGPPGNVPPADAAAVEGFRHAFGQDLRIDRGGAKIFEIPPDASYRKRSGISHLGVLGIRVPEDKSGATGETPQQFPRAAESALRGLAQQRIRGVGIPAMDVRRTFGESRDKDSSWIGILREIDLLAPTAGIASVLYGGWTILATNRASADSAFRTAWSAHKAELAKRTGEIVHEQIRLAALLIFAALLAWHLRGTLFTWKRVLGLAMLAAGFTYSIAQVGDWAAKHFFVGATSTFLLEALAALALGALIETVVRFNPKDIISGKEN